MWGTLASVPEAVAQVSREYLSAIWPRFLTVSTDRIKRWLIAWLFATSLAWTWSDVSFDTMVQVGVFLTLSLGLFLVFSGVLWFNVSLPPRYRPRWWITAGGVLSAFILLLCAVGGGIGLYRKLLAG